MPSERGFGEGEKRKAMVPSWGVVEKIVAHTHGGVGRQPADGNPRDYLVRW
eukprot:COSAG02_NODE_30084_length_557_cov_1.296943_1_plen_51_part_00